MRQNRGTVYKLKNPENPKRAWRAKVRVYFPDGSSKELARHGETRRQALSNLDEAVNHALHKFKQQSRQSVNDVFHSLLETKKINKQLKRNSIGNNLDLYNLHIKPAIGAKPLNAVSYEDLDGLLKSLMADGKFRTVGLTKMLLNEIYKHALTINRKRIAAGTYSLINIAQDLTPVPQPPKNKSSYIWTDEEREKFKEAAKTRYENSATSLSYPLFYTMLSAGLRIGEALGIRIVDFKDSHLEVRQQYASRNGRLFLETPKTKASIRDIPISEDHAEVLNKHLKRIETVKKYNPDFIDKGLLLPSFAGTPFSHSNLRRTRLELCQQAGVTEIPNHTMRKIYCTLLTKSLLKENIWSPKLVAELMGHSSTTVAMEIYTQVIKDDKMKAVVRV